MPLQLVILIGAVIVSWLVFNWLVKVVKTTVGTAFAIAIILLILQLAFGINPQELWQQIITLPQTLWSIITGSNR